MRHREVARSSGWLQTWGSFVIHNTAAPRRQAPWTATLVQNWRAGYVDANPNGQQRRVAPYQVWDAQFGYAGGADWTLAIGVKNLLGRDPPFTNQQSFFQIGYDPGYADPRGRLWYARVGLRWR